MLRIADVPLETITSLLQQFDLELFLEEPDSAITGSFWGDSEAGIVGRSVYVRADTPIHSMLHETCHILCMTEERRSGLDRDAGGSDIEEAAVCYLQLILADSMEGVGRDRLMLDMDEWGYSFRLGNTQDWFQHDAEDAREFLINHGLLNSAGDVTFRLRY
jgi:hypothetical protein